MTFRKLLFGVGFFTVLSLVAWTTVFFFVDPDSYGSLGSALFLGTAFSFLVGAFTMTLVGIGGRFLGDSDVAASFGIFFRQGFLLASFIAILLFLSRFRLLAWWNAALAFAGILLIELSVRAVAERNGGNGTS